MEKRIEDFLHLYLGARCICIKSFKGLPDYWAEGDNAVVTPTILIDAEKFKPILRPLSDMSEEEKRLYDSKDQSAEGLRYLLTIHVDLFGLIEANLAIDKTKIKTGDSVS